MGVTRPSEIEAIGALRPAGKRAKRRKLPTDAPLLERTPWGSSLATHESEKRAARESWVPDWWEWEESR